MKSLIFVLAIFGACYASQQQQEQPGWDIGKTYTYTVQGHALSGLKVDQHGGLQLQYRVKLTRQGQNQYYLQPSNFQVVTNCQNQCQQVQNRPIPQSLLQYLESPIQYSMNQQGKVNSIKFQHSIPSWAMNFKKAQMAPFVTYQQYPQQLTHQQQQQPQQSQYQQNEKTVYGDCKVQYQYEQYGQQNQQDQQDQYSAQYQQQKLQQPQKPWYSRITGGQDNGSSSSESDEQQQQQQQQQHQHQHQQNNQYNNGNNYNDDDSPNDNSAAGFFARLGRKMGMTQSDSDEDSQEQDQQQNQIQRGSRQQSSSEESQEQQRAAQKACNSNDQKFQYTKTYKVSDCSHTPNFSNSSSTAGQRNIQRRQIFTRYYACGPNKNQYQIYRIERREATKQAQEATQQLTLTDISSASSSSSRASIQQPSVYSNLAYNFEVQQLRHIPIVEMDKQEYQKQLRSHNGVGQVIIYQDSNFEGQHTTLDLGVDKCIGLPTGWNDVISSIDPQLSCVILWEHKACTGEAIRLERHSWGASHLDRVLMDDKTSSIQLCL